MVSEQAIFSRALKIKILKPIICYLNFILLILNPSIRAATFFQTILCITCGVKMELNINISLLAKGKASDICFFPRVPLSKLSAS